MIERPCNGNVEAVRLAVRDADAVFVRESPIDRAAIDGMERCRAIVRYGVGVDNIDLAAAAERRIHVANVPDYGVEEVSDQAIAPMFAVVRRIASRDRDVRAGRWNVARQEPMYRLAGRTLGVIGYGRVGAAFLRKTSALGFTRTLVYDPAASALPDHAEAADLDAIFTQADIVSLHLPLLPTTARLVSAERLAAMKPEAIIINTSRGGLIDEAALAAALTEGRLGGAGLDVYAVEPPADSPLLTLRNAVLTDHTGWYSEESVAELQTKAAQEIARVFAGEAPRHWVNRWT